MGNPWGQSQEVIKEVQEIRKNHAHESVPGTNLSTTGTPFWRSSDGAINTAETIADSHLVNVLEHAAKSGHFKVSDRWLLLEARNRRLMKRLVKFKKYYGGEIRWLADVLQKEVVRKPSHVRKTWDEMRGDEVKLSQLVKSASAKKAKEMLKNALAKKEIGRLFFSNTQPFDPQDGWDIKEYYFDEVGPVDSRALRDVLVSITIEDLCRLADEWTIPACLSVMEVGSIAHDEAVQSIINTIEDLKRKGRKFSLTFFVAVEEAIIPKKENMDKTIGQLEVELLVLRAKAMSLEEELRAERTFSENIMAGFKKVGEFGGKGALMNRLTAANRLAVETFVERLGDNAPTLMKSEAGKLALMGAIPSAVVVVCETDLAVPKREYVSMAGELGVMGAGAEATQAAANLVALMFGDIFTDLFQAYSKVGEEHAKMIGETPPDFSEEIEKLKVVEKEKARR